MSAVTINSEQRLFVIPCGKGYTCLGFDVCERQRIAVWQWLSKPLRAVAIGTMEQWQDYSAAMDAGSQHAAQTGQRCPIDLVPAFVGHEGEQVEITEPDGSKRRFYIGKSTGWMPCHIELKRRGSNGGMAAFVPKGSKIRFTGTRRR